MTPDQIAELERLLDAYRASYGSTPTAIGRARRRLETALVRHAEDLIAAATAHMPPFSPYVEVHAHEKPWRDPNHPGNSLIYRKLGRKCIEPGCNEPAGTRWSPLWCFRHNVERMDRIDAQFERVEKALKIR